MYPNGSCCRWATIAAASDFSIGAIANGETKNRHELLHFHFRIIKTDIVNLNAVPSLVENRFLDPIKILPRNFYRQSYLFP